MNTPKTIAVPSIEEIYGRWRRLIYSRHLSVRFQANERVRIYTPQSESSDRADMGVAIFPQHSGKK